MENDLISIYAEQYLYPQNTNNSKPINESVSNHSQEREIIEESKKRKDKAKSSKGKAKSSKNKAGKDYYESVDFDNVFDKIIREEFGDEGGDDAFANDNTYDFDGEGDDMDGDMDGGEEQTFSLSELRSMTLGELAELVSGGATDEFEDEGGDETFDMEDGDEIPQESYAFDGGGRSHGMQGQYDGKAKTGSRSTHVKDNGDSDFGNQDTGYDPEDTEGSEGCEHGMQGEYDGKAKTGSKTTHVKSNGDADFGKQKTGARTSSGKKDRNYF
jgi:hypothetical protein